MRPSPLTLAFLFALPAYAQQAPSPDDDESSKTPVTLDPIIVRAEKPLFDNYTVPASPAATGLDTALKDTPQSITVLTQKQIEDQGHTNLGEILAQTPGMYQKNWGNHVAGNTSHWLRGYAVGEYRIDGSISLTDGKRPRALGNDSAVYESVTVVRGSTGLMQGVGNPGGSVAISRKQPTAERRFSLEAGAGSWRHGRLVLDAGGALNSDATLRGRAIVAHDHGGEYLRRAKQHHSTLYGALAYDLSPQTTLHAGIEHRDLSSNNSSGLAFTRYYGDAQNGWLPTPFDRRDNSAANWTHGSIRKSEIFARAEHILPNDWHLSASYAYSTGRHRLLYGTVGAGDIAADGAAELTSGIWHYRPEEHRASLKLQGSYELFGRSHPFNAEIAHNDYDDYDTMQYERVFTPVDSVFDFVQNGGSVVKPDIPEGGKGGDKSRLTGIGASTALSLHERVTLTLGGRLSSWHNRQRQMGTGFEEVMQKENAVFTPFVGLTYALTPNLNAYASYAGIFNPQDRQDEHYHRLPPEQGNTVEAGIKSAWADGRVNASAAVFASHKDNVAVRAGEHPDGTSYYHAEDNIKTRGAELTLSGEIADGLRLDASYTYAKSKDAQGSRINYELPLHQAKLFTTYEVNDRLSVGAGARWQSAIEDDPAWLPDPDNAELRRLSRQKAYGVVDLTARYQAHKNLHFAVHLNNLFDQKAHNIPYQHDYITPRNIMATVKYTLE